MQNICKPLLCETFSLVTDVVEAITHDADSLSVVTSLGGGGTILQVVDPVEECKMFDIQKFMLDMHPDVLCTMKGVMVNNRSERTIGMEEIVTWGEVTSKVSATFNVDPSFKFADRDGGGR